MVNVYKNSCILHGWCEVLPIFQYSYIHDPWLHHFAWVCHWIPVPTITNLSSLNILSIKSCNSLRVAIVTAWLSSTWVISADGGFLLSREEHLTRRLSFFSVRMVTKTFGGYKRTVMKNRWLYTLLFTLQSLMCEKCWLHLLNSLHRFDNKHNLIPNTPDLGKNDVDKQITHSVLQSHNYNTWLTPACNLMLTNLSCAFNQKWKSVEFQTKFGPNLPAGIPDVLLLISITRG